MREENKKNKKTKKKMGFLDVPVSPSTPLLTGVYAIPEPVLFGGFPTVSRGGHNVLWPKSGPSGNMTLALEEIPNASKRGTK